MQMVLSTLIKFVSQYQNKRRFAFNILRQCATDGRRRLKMNKKLLWKHFSSFRFFRSSSIPKQPLTINPVSQSSRRALTKLWHDKTKIKSFTYFDLMLCLGHTHSTDSFSLDKYLYAILKTIMVHNYTFMKTVKR